MTSHHHAHRRPFLDVAEAETSADFGTLRDALFEAARDADRLGLPDVKEHVEAALDSAEEHGEGGDGA